MGKTKKRNFVVILIIALFVGGWVGLLQNTLSAETLVVCSWGGAYSDAQRAALFKPFEEKTGIKIIDVAPTSTAKIKAMVTTGNIEWDVADVSAAYVILLQKQGLLEKIDYSGFDKKLFDEAVEGTFIPYAVGHSFYSTIMAYRTDVFSKERPRNWKDFWDVKRFPGPRCLMNGTFSGSLEFALMADGVPIDKLYPLDIARAYKKLTEIKPHVVKWWDAGAIPAQLLTDKEVVLTNSWHGRILKILEEGAPVAIEWNQGGLNSMYWGIPKGTKNYKNALKFIEFSIQAENQARWVNYYRGGIGPINKRAFSLIKPEILKNTPTAPENLKMQFLCNSEWWGENLERTTEYWHKWTVQK
jgi:putative spermidine/putrescine transport system substrate-binding protein